MMHSPARTRAWSAALVVALLLGLLGLLGLPAAPAGATAADPPRPEPRSAWFGPELDWEQDTATDYRRRLGAEASLFGRTVGYPLTTTSAVLLDDLSRQTAAAAAVGVLTVEPADLVGLTDQDALDLASAVAEATERDGSFLLVRFAPEMNGAQRSWARRPLTYVARFRTLAEALHEATQAAEIVWSPTYGGGYPFTSTTEPSVRSSPGTPGAPEFDRRNLPYLDTDGDGEVTAADDPYGPYYPGDTYVDWVGLTLLRDAPAAGTGGDPAPAADEVDAAFKEPSGSPDAGAGRTFYVRFAGTKDQPFLLSTAALDPPGTTSTVEEEWLRQVVGAVGTRPMLMAVQWLEHPGLADDPALASLARVVLEQGPISLGPVADIGEGSSPGDADVTETGPADEAATADSAAPTSDDSDLPAFLRGMLVTLAVVLVTAAVALRVRRRRAVPTWLR